MAKLVRVKLKLKHDPEPIECIIKPDLVAKVDDLSENTIHMWPMVLGGAVAFLGNEVSNVKAIEDIEQPDGNTNNS